MSTQTPEACIGLWEYVGGARTEMERALMSHLPLAPVDVDRSFNEALCYALFPGGKRLRPVMTLLGAELVGGDAGEVLSAATAVEYVHTSSLIFDDLPCMDNASERRGLEALHLRYSESLAVLVALALLNTSYGLVFEHRHATRRQSIQAHAELVACIGTNGMVTGQTVDLSGEAVRDDGDVVRNLKTSALMRLSLRLGAILSGADSRQLAALSRFAELLGQAYQISDDVIDLAEDASFVVGGRAATLAIECGPRGAKLHLTRMLDRAKGALLAEFGRTRPALVLCEMADYIAGREA